MYCFRTRRIVSRIYVIVQEFSLFLLSFKLIKTPTTSMEVRVVSQSSKVGLTQCIGHNNQVASYVFAERN